LRLLFYSTGGAVYSPALTDFTFMVKVRTLSLYSLHVERELPADRVTCGQSCLWIDCVSVFCRKCSMCCVAILPIICGLCWNRCLYHRTFFNA